MQLKVLPFKIMVHYTPSLGLSVLLNRMLLFKHILNVQDFKLIGIIGLGLGLCIDIYTNIHTLHKIEIFALGGAQDPFRDIIPISSFSAQYVPTKIKYDHHKNIQPS